jgi:hypothetical protein
MKCMADFRYMFVAIFRLTLSILSRVQAQSRETTRVPDRFEFLKGHAHRGGDWGKWEHDQLVFAKRVADMTGKGSFAETTEQLSPTSHA